MDEIEKRKINNVFMFQAMHPSNSHCNKCGLPWAECKSKSINYSPSSGVFAMCEYCWEHSDVEERVHHFKTLWYEHRNRHNHTYDFTVIEAEIRKQSQVTWWEAIQKRVIDFCNQIMNL